MTDFEKRQVVFQERQRVLDEERKAYSAESIDDPDVRAEREARQAITYLNRYGLGKPFGFKR